MESIMITISFSAIWSCYAIRRQSSIYGFSLWQVALCGILNFVFCPLCMIIAILKEN